MLKEAVRRLLWLGPTLLVVTLPIFWAIARATDLTARAPSSPLPLFFNPSPAGVRERALAAVSLVASGGESASDGAETLSRLGGAALPYVLAQFDIPVRQVEEMFPAIVMRSDAHLHKWTPFRAFRFSN